MIIYSQCKHLNYLMPYPYMWKQHDSVNEMHSIGNENCEHLIALAYVTVQQVDSTSKHVH